MSDNYLQNSSGLFIPRGATTETAGRERGYSSIYHSLGGKIEEEFIPNLDTLEKRVKKYKEMSWNDPTIVAALRAIRSLVSQVEWTVEPVSDKPEDLVAKEFLEQCFNDLKTPFHKIIVNRILSAIVYGFCILEVVYKKRDGKLNRNKEGKYDSKYTDGKIGWMDFPIRSQDSIEEWIFDKRNEVIGVKQRLPDAYQTIDLYMNDILLFTPDSEKDNPEGTSMLRGAYRPYEIKKQTEELFIVGAGKDMVNMLIVRPPAASLDPNNPANKPMIEYFKKLVQGHRVNKHFGMLIPKEVEVDLLKSGGSKTFNLLQYLEYFDRKEAMVLLADFILLGHSGAGSYSLSSDKTRIFATLVGGVLDDIEYVYNTYAIPRLFNRNYFKITEYPRLKHGDLEKLELTSLMLLIQSANQHGMPILTMDIVNHVFKQFGIPTFKTEEDFKKALETSAKFSEKGYGEDTPEDKDQNDNDNNEDEDEDE